MRDLIKGALIRVALASVVAAGVGGVTGLGGETERSIRAERAGATANPRCAPRPIKMPCFLGGRDAHRG
jgi:hypothetical protein